MGILVLAPADCAANMISRLEGTVCNHGEDVNDIMGEAVNSVENILVVILDFEIAAGHLCDAIINCLVGVDGGFQYACLRSDIAPLDSESSSLVPTSANTPIWTLDGTETDSVSTVRPDGNLVDLYVGGTGVKTLWGILGWVWMDDDAKL